MASAGPQSSLTTGGLAGSAPSPPPPNALHPPAGAPTSAQTPAQSPALALLPPPGPPPAPTPLSFEPSTKTLVIGNRVALITFGLARFSLCIYGLCGQTVHFVNLTAQELALKVRMHGLRCRACRDLRMDSDSIRKPFLDEQLPGSTRSVATQTGVVVAKEFFDWAPIKSLVDSGEYKLCEDQVFCDGCISHMPRTRRGADPCCSLRRPRSFNSYKRLFSDPIPFLPAAEISAFYTARVGGPAPSLGVLQAVEQLVTAGKVRALLQESKGLALELTSLIASGNDVQPQNVGDGAALALQSPAHATTSLQLVSPVPAPNFGATNVGLDADPPSLVEQSAMTTTTTTTTPLFSEPLPVSAPVPSPVGSSSSRGFSGQLFDARQQHVGLLRDVRNNDLIFVSKEDPTIGNSLLLRAGLPNFAVYLNHTAQDPLQRACNVEHADSPALKKLRDGGSKASERFVGIFFGDRTPSAEERASLSRATRIVDRNDLTDKVLLLGIRTVLRMGAEICVNRVSPSVLASFNDAMFDGHRGSRADDPSVILSGGFPGHVSQSRETDDASCLTRVLRSCVELGMPGFELLSESLMLVKSENQARGINEVERWNLSHLQDVLLRLLYGLACNPEPNTTRLVRAFVFRSQGSPAGPNLYHGVDAAAAADDDEEEDGGDVDNDPAQFEGLNKPSLVSRIISSLFRAFKIAVAFTYDARMFEQNGVLQASAQFKQVSSPVDVVLAELRQGRNMQDLAMLARTLKPLSESPASALNSVNFHQQGAAREPVIQHGKDLFDGLVIRESVDRAVSGCLDRLFACVGATTAADQEQIRRALFATDNDPLALGIVQTSAQTPDCPTLNVGNAFCSSLSDRARVLPDLSVRVEELRDVVLADIAMLVGGVVRAPELARLELATGPGLGNVYLVATYFAVPTLAYADIVQKTSREAFAMLPSWLSRVLLVLLQLLGPLTADLVTSTFRDLLIPHPDDDEHVGLHDDPAASTWGDASFAEVASKWRKQLSTRVSFRGRLSPTFAKFVRESREAQGGAGLVTVQRAVDTGLFFAAETDVRNIVKRRIAVEALGSGMTFGQLRHFLIIWRTHLPEMLLYDLRNGRFAEGQKAVIEALVADLNAHAADFATLEALGTIGMHSPQVGLGHYQAQARVGSRTIPALKAKSTTLVEAFSGVFCGFAFPNSTVGIIQNGVPVHFHRKRTIWEDICALDPLLHGSETADEYLTRTLASTFNMQWLSTEQRLAALNNFAQPGHSMNVMPCGSGKTLTYLAPFSLAPVGVTVVVFPYVALCESMFAYARDTLGLPCELFDSHQPRFSANAFSSNSRLADDPIRFIFIVSDTAVSPSTLSFLHAAANHRRLNGIVIDEAHQLVLSLTFRESMRRVPFLVNYGAKLVLVSGTIPPCLEETLLRTFSMQRASVSIVRRPDVYGERLETNLQQFPPGTAVSNLALSRYVASLARARLQRQPENRRPFLVFGLTRKTTTEMKNIVSSELANVQGLRTTHLDSRTSPDGRASFFESFRAAREPGGPLVVGFTTSAAAEGVDFPDIGTVIVAGGVFGGVLTLHQMFSRAGRGVGTRAQVFFVYAPSFIKRYAFGRNNGDLAQYDIAALAPILSKDRGAARRLVGFGSLAGLFGGEDTCGGVRMETLLGTPTPSASCATCCSCEAEHWLYPHVQANSSDVNDGDQGLAEADELGVGPANPSLVFQAEEQIRSDVLQFLSPLGDTYCISCGVTHPNARDMLHFPNRCSLTLSVLRGTRCWTCLGVGHKRAAFKGGQQQPGESLEQYRNRKEAMFNDVAVTGCLELVVDCSAWRTFKPCHRCYLQHPEGVGACPTRNQTMVRHALIVVWNVPWLRTLFYAREYPEGLGGEGWVDFVRWVLYRGSAHLQNAWRLLNFFREMQSTWIAHRDQPPPDLAGELAAAEQRREDDSI